MTEQQIAALLWIGIGLLVLGFRNGNPWRRP